MKCEECLPVLEEYADGELNERAARRLASHLNTCAACANAFGELKREAEIFARYQRDIEITPALWNAVRTRIAEEKFDQAFAPAAPWQGWFTTLRHALRFNPALASALALVLIGIAAGLVRYIQLRRVDAPSTELAYRKPESGNDQISSAQSKIAEPRDTGKSNVELRSFANGDDRIASNRNVPQRKVAGFYSISKGRVEGVNLKPRTHGNEHPPDVPAVISEASTRIPDDNLTAGLREFTHAPQSDSKEETFKHLEQSQLLLRSFRNASFSPNDSVSDIAYERRQSRKLLYRNILLRRDAAAKGNLPIEDALNSLEPVLLDIANLPLKPSPDDVRSIKERIQRNEIVAELQVYTARTASAGY